MPNMGANGNESVCLFLKQGLQLFFPEKPGQEKGAKQNVVADAKGRIVIGRCPITFLHQVVVLSFEFINPGSTFDLRKFS